MNLRLQLLAHGRRAEALILRLPISVNGLAGNILVPTAAELLFTGIRIDTQRRTQTAASGFAVSAASLQTQSA
jgi:hypothetical protein